jgi:NAD(P)-dependent dehydrogenase (short-subunit alcohol dehydrogenase family)
MTAPNRRVCVIGAQGALGNAVVEQFRSAGWQVHPAGRRPEERNGFRQLDLDRPETIAPAIRNVDLVTAIWIGARRGTERLGASIIECDGDYRTTAAAARIFGERAIDVNRSGCFNPEDLFNSSDLLTPLQEVGMRVAKGNIQARLAKR